MANNPKVSIIVPVYNQEALLGRCVDSLIHQTLTDIEIILVDDGSTDASPEICDKYAREDSRIKVIHKDNGGSASARQAALDILSGEYCVVCDSDDWVETDMYERMYNVAKSTLCEVVICGFFYDYPDGTTKTYSPKSEGVLNGDVLKDILLEKISSSTCNKIIQTCFLRGNDIHYVEGINLGEDLLFSVQCALKNAKYASVPIPFYHYSRRHGEQTYTNNLSLDSYYQLAKSVDWLDDNLGDRYSPEGVFHRKINLVFSGMRTTGMTPKILQQSALNRFTIGDFKRYRARSIKDIYVFFIKVFGYRMGSLIMKLSYSFFYR